MSCFMNLHGDYVSDSNFCNSERVYARFKVKEFCDGIFFAVRQMQASAGLQARSFDRLDLNK